MDRILVSGASGPIGKALLSSFETQGTQVVRLVRGRAQNAAQVSWDPLAPLPPAAVSGFDAVVHLAGESIVGRWTAEKKKAIRESRVQGTLTLAAALARAEAKPQGVGVRLGGRLLRESRRRASTRRESAWAGISGRGLPRVGGGQPDCGRGWHSHGQHPDRAWC